MKKLLFVIATMVLTVSVSAQELIDIYKSGTVKLVPDTEYARGNDWDQVFRTYYDTLYSKPMGGRKSLKMMPDGSVVVNHAYRNYYSRFSPGGKFQAEFGVKRSNGEGFQKINPIEGIINDNIFFTGLDNMGNMICFDFNGNYIKTLKLDYMTRQMIPLPNNKIAVVGWVLWKTKFRDFVAIVDYDTNNERIIWEHFTDRPLNTGQFKAFNYGATFEKGGAFSFTTMPYSKITGINSPPKIACVDEKLVVGIPATGKIHVYDLEGNLISESRIEWATRSISPEEQKEIQQKAIDQFESASIPGFSSQGVSPEESKSIKETILKKMKTDLENITGPLPFPTFSTLIRDSGGNILFFEFPEENETNKFNVWVYESGGKFVCQSSFICDDYNLEITPSKMVFHNGYLYGLQELKDADGVPLRLVRFSLTNN